jgi:NADPH:quinone reductase-like Zn-dependent oxidoreductase
LGGEPKPDEARRVPDPCDLRHPQIPEALERSSATLRDSLSLKVIQGASRQRTEDLVFLRELSESGRIRTVIDRRFLLEQIPDAQRYFESGLARGRVVISL